MPIYLCALGEGKPEPWKHHVHVYSVPFDMDSKNPPTDASTTARPPTTITTRVVTDKQPDETSPLRQLSNTVEAGQNTIDNNDLPTTDANPDLPIDSNSHPNWNQADNSHPAAPGSSLPVRRIRHAEIVLADDVCIAYDRYWLRLRWPGSKGGFAGYIDMGYTSNYQISNNENEDIRNVTSKIDFSNIRSACALSEDRGMHDDTDPDDPTRDDNIATPPSEPYDPEITNNTLKCSRTGLEFPSSVPLKLLALYDDGITPKVTLAPFPTEQIFCRICREGLHEDADTEQPNAANEDADNTNTNRDTELPEILNGNDYNDDDDDEPSTIKTSEPFTVGPVIPHPTYASNTDALQNPMLAPCECAGSMAFVHYMCVEQWRCRSRHPHAHNGLNCETCGKPYALPPPSERQGVQLEHEDWLDAMPPHVMQALRQPHIWWQLGAAIVRRRWLRPLAPIFMSPVVALYCRARRLLKKRGVARRRWACSLCRRRARWKCVRCLRSYYCSRQCQNVSWHIIHKHVCYKPVRFWWSVVVYGAMALLVFPGILRDPLMYDLGVCIIPISFVIMAVLGGGIASIVKRISGIDIRGRLLELAAVVSTLWLGVISWGLIRGFFGKPSLCYGSFGLTYNLTIESISASYNILRPFRWAVLQPVEKLYLFWDRLILKTFWLRILFCTKSARVGNETIVTGCFEHTPHANADFILMNMNQTISSNVSGASVHDDYFHNNKCAADLTIVLCLYILAGVAFAGSTFLKHQERQRRRLRHHHHQHQFAFHLQQQQQQQPGNRPRLAMGIGFAQLQQRAVGGGDVRPHQD